MYQGQFSTLSNGSTWITPVIEAVDEDDDNAVLNLADPAYEIAIRVTVGEPDRQPVLVGDLVNGQVFIVGPGFQWAFADTDMNRLCAGTYRLDVRITIDGFVTDLIIGTIAVIEGGR